MAGPVPPQWQLTEVQSPHIANPVPTIIARDISYIPNGHRFQTLSIYLPPNPTNNALLSQPITSLPTASEPTSHPPIYVHIHGGAWRDPNLTSASLEAAIAHAFSAPSSQPQFSAIISLNYTLTQFPTHPTQPYTTRRTHPADPSREAVHPAHVRDILYAFSFLRTLGLQSDGYILSGHSAGACLAFQASLADPARWGAGVVDGLRAPPRPKALLGMNGLYDLSGLVHRLGESHEHLRGVYKDLLGLAFGEEEGWARASPAMLEVTEVQRGVDEGRVPRVVVVDQSVEDQLVPVNQADRMEEMLRGVSGIKVVRNRRLAGSHAAPWEEGKMIWEELLDVSKLLSNAY